jgi:hypothetical protein
LISTHYFIRWNPVRFRDPDPFARALTLPEAAKLHENRSQHTAVCMEGNALLGTVESHNDFVGCNFFDELNRLYLSYGFRTQPNGRLFLADTVFHLFDGDSSNRRMTENSFFTVDGQYRMVINDFANAETRESQPRSIDVMGHWEDYPKFERYNTILRLER